MFRYTRWEFTCVCVLSLKFSRLPVRFELLEFYGTFNWFQFYKNTCSALKAVGCIMLGGHDSTSCLYTDPAFVQYWAQLSS